MVIGTFLIVVTPTYGSIGIAAPIIIVIARLVQGFSAGGEMGSALSYLVEYAPAKRKILFASFQQLTQLLALLVGSLIGAVVNASLSATSVESWGWRLPFVLGLLIAPVGWYIRKKTEEPPAFAKVLERRQEQKLAGLSEDKPSPWSTLIEHPRETLGGFCITVLWTVSTYFFLVFMPTYAVRQLGLPASSSLFSNSVSLLVAAICTPFFAALADRIGPARILAVAAVAISACVYPALMTLSREPSVSTLVFVQSGFAILIASFTGPAGGALASLFPDEKRSMGVSIAYNFAVTIFGGFAPFIATWLIQSTGNKLSPAYYVASAGVLAVVGVLLSGKSLKRQ